MRWISLTALSQLPPVRFACHFIDGVTLILFIAYPGTQTSHTDAEDQRAEAQPQRREPLLAFLARGTPKVVQVSQELFDSEEVRFTAELLPGVGFMFPTPVVFTTAERDGGASAVFLQILDQLFTVWQCKCGAAG